MRKYDLLEAKQGEPFSKFRCATLLGTALDQIIPLGDGRKPVPVLLLDLPAKPATRDSNKVGPERSCPQNVEQERIDTDSILS